MSKVVVKRKLPLLVIGGVVILAFTAFFISKPIDSFAYSTSGCVGLGTSVNVTQRYSLLGGEKPKFYEDKKKVDPKKIGFMYNLCDSDTMTHQLYLF